MRVAQKVARRRSVDGVMRILMACFLRGEVGGGEAGIEAAGCEPEHGGGDDDDAYGGHNASYLTHLGRIGKGLELPVFPSPPAGRISPAAAGYCFLRT